MLFRVVVTVTLVLLATTTTHTATVVVPSSNHNQRQQQQQYVGVADGISNFARLVETERTVDSVNTTKVVDALVVDKEHAIGELRALRSDSERLNATLARHQSNHEYNMDSTREAMAHRRRLNSQHHNLEDLCQQKRFENMRRVDAADTAIKAIQTALDGGSFGDVNVTKLLEGIGMPDIEVSGKIEVFQKLLGLVNETRIRLLMEGEEQQQKCKDDIYLLDSRIANVSTEIQFGVMAAAETDQIIASLIKEQEYIVVLRGVMQNATNILDNLIRAAQEGFQQRESSRNSMLRLAKEASHRVNLAHNTNYSSVTPADAAALCLDSNNEVCGKRGKCQKGICVCEKGFMGGRCATQMRCPFPPPTDTFAHLSAVQLLNCSKELSTVGSVCPVKCLKGDEVSYQLTCLPSGQWNIPIQRCDPIECSLDSLVVPEFTRVNCQGNLVGQKCTFECALGTTTIEGSTSHVTCQANGEWSQVSGAVCQIGVCNKIDPIENGDVSCDGFAHGSVCRFKCNEGYQLRGPGAARCLANRTWSSNIPTCQKTQCPKLGAILHGRWESTGTSFNDSAVVKCNEGFILPAAVDRNRVCLSTGAWSGSGIRSCRVPGCVGPPTAKNGYSFCPNGTVVNASCLFTCESGGDPSDKANSALLTCQEGNRWVGETNRCEINKCALPPPIPHATIDCQHFISKPEHSIDRLGESQLTKCGVVCKKGFKLVGDGVAVCSRSEGFWNVLGSCEPVGCGAPKELENGVTLCTGSMPGHSCHPYCSSGFKSGKSELLCSAGGEWVGKETNETAFSWTCDAVSCGEIPQPHFGAHNCTGTTFGHICTTSCPTGHVTSGDGMFVCSADGEWVGSGTCLPDSCDIFDLPEHATTRCTGTAVGDSCVTECSDGFEVKQGSQVRSCAPGGVWTGSHVICGVVECPALSSIPGGSLQCVSSPLTSDNVTSDSLTSDKTMPFLSRCDLTCNEGFSNEVSSFVCGASGEWVGDGGSSVPACSPVICETPPSISNGEVVCRDSRSCSIECSEGFQLVGSQGEMRCDRNGKWSLGEAVCDPISCGSPPRASQGNLVECSPPLVRVTTKLAALASIRPEDSMANIVGTTCTFVCASDVFALRCGVGGVWETTMDQPYPVCAQACGLPPAPRNGSVVCNENVSECSIRCDVGFRLVGSSSLSCEGEGAWSGPVGQCVPATCTSRKPTVSNGRAVCDGNSFASQCRFVCQPGFTLYGSNIAKCDETGNWRTDQEPSCQLRQCSMEEIQSDDDNNNNAPSVKCKSQNGRQLCRATCPEGTTMTGSEIRVCDVNGRWAGTPPQCHPVSCSPLPEPSTGMRVCHGHGTQRICNLSCGKGREVIGAESQQCLSVGAWSGGLPSDCSVRAGA